MTAIGALLISLSFVMLAFCLRTFRSIALCAVMLIWILGLMVFFSSPGVVDEALSSVGRDRTFTGRLQLWAETWDIIKDRPVLGYGYSAFWQEQSRLAVEVGDSIGWSPENAHSAYLDLALQLGAVGLILFAATVGRALVGFMSTLSFGAPIQIYWTAGLLGFVLAESLMETQLLRRNELTTVLFVATVVMVAQRSSSSKG